MAAAAGAMAGAEANVTQCENELEVERDSVKAR